MKARANTTVFTVVSVLALVIGACGKQPPPSQEPDGSSSVRQSSREKPESEVTKDEAAPTSQRDAGPIAPVPGTPEGTHSEAAQPDTEGVILKKGESQPVATEGQKDITPEEVSSHRVLYQEGINVIVAKDGDGRSEIERIAVYGVAGLRFPARTLEVDHRARLSRTVITIENADGGFLIPQAGSAVPVNMGFDESVKYRLSFFTHAINTTWKFAKPGIRFHAGGSIYESERAGASISFTEDGVKLDGIRNVAKE